METWLRSNNLLQPWKGAMNWLRQYGLNHFNDYDNLKNGLLGRFRREKTAGDLLKNN